MSKRVRSTNWDEEEKQLFYSVLKHYVQILQDKSLKTDTNKLKNKAWKEVHQKFNSLNNRKRDLKQLKIQWKGMKTSARKEHGKHKACNQTGGGARPATPQDTIIEIRDLLNPGELTIDHNSYDSDGMQPARNIHPTKQQCSSLNSQKDHDYITDHSKELKDNDHKRKMEMAEEKHAFEIEILKKKLKNAQLEGQILEAKLKKLSD